MKSPGLLGVLGGMGPLATIDFLHKLLAATPATMDQDHVPVVTMSIPQVPDRTAAFRGDGVSPLPAMIEGGQRLIDAGASLIVIPCNTAHLWYEPLRDALAIPMIHIVDAALEDAVAVVGSGGNIGLLATDATTASGLYVNRKAPQGHALQWLLPTASEMIELVMPGISAVKSGDTKRGGTLLAQAAASLGKRGATAVVLGCTEIPVVLNSMNAPVPVIDATQSLARRSVAWARSQQAGHGADAAPLQG
jgi:aspartate racemase